MSRYTPEQWIASVAEPDMAMEYMGSSPVHGMAFVQDGVEVLREVLADRDRLAAELDDLRETVEWLKGVPPEEKVREELNAAARLDLRRWQRFRGPGAVGNPTMHYEDFLAFRAREQGRKDSQEEISQLRAELARVRRNHLRRMEHDAIDLTCGPFRFTPRDHARLNRIIEGCRAALAQPKDGTTEGRA